MNSIDKRIKERLKNAKVTPEQLVIGAKFDTPFETGCVIVGEYDPICMSFDAEDSEGIVCGFDILMVERIYDNV